MKEKILIVEDDENIAGLIRYNLEKSGYDCATQASGEAAIELLSREKSSLIILDIMLPGIDGLEVCRRIKQNNRTSHIPVIMLTARGEEVDRIVGLELGADDYLVKPFSPRELVLRVKAILRRAQDTGASPVGEVVLISGVLELDTPRHKVTVAGIPVELTSLEFKLLATLMGRRGRVQTRDNLLSDVWDIAADVTTRTIDTHVKRLRQKLGEAGEMIETIRGVGYRFKE